MLDSSLRATVRNFSTLFLLVLVIVLPLHLIYAYVFHDVFTVSELHTQIAQLPGKRQVHDVGPQDLRNAQILIVLLGVVELALLPVVARGAGRVLAIDGANGVPTATDAWRHIVAQHARPCLPSPRANAAVLVPSAFVAVLVGYLVERIGLVVIQPLQGEHAWIAVGVVQALARAAGAPWLLAAVALAAPGAARR